MKFLIVGDIVGRTGLDRLKIELNKRKDIDFCIVNGENSASGRGIRRKEYDEILDAGADIITMGNHMYYRKEMASEYSKLNRLAIPANLTNLNGNKNILVEKNGIKVGVINLLGTFAMGDMIEKNIDNPFKVVIEQIDDLKSKNVDYIFIDFHAEATAEKIAMKYFLDGKATVLFGTHTHVQTADEDITKKGLGYITDLGMTGPKESVIGMNKEASIKRFLTSLPERYKLADGNCMLNGCIFEINDENCKTEKIT